MQAHIFLFGRLCRCMHVILAVSNYLSHCCQIMYCDTIANLAITVVFLSSIDFEISGNIKLLD
jgi:hypothetical protein